MSQLRSTSAVPYWLGYVTLLVFVAGIQAGGMWTWLPVLFVFVALPLMDALAAPHVAYRDDRPGRWIYDLPLFAWPALQVLAGVLALGAVGRETTTPLATIGIVSSLGLLSGSVGINVAHELMHRSGRLERGLAELLMTLVAYPHFCIEHVLGHHKNVATPRDPATARLGESVYAFVGRVVPESLASAWRLEKRRVDRLGLTPFGVRDRRARQPVLLAAVMGVVGYAFGGPGLAVFLGQAIVAVALLEAINYLEHYGLRRREVKPGQYERVEPRHAWSSSHRFSNWYLFNLARHADHHMIAARPYEQLRPLDHGPELPAGYSAMLLLAWYPPAWFRVMNPRARRLAEDA